MNGNVPRIVAPWSIENPTRWERFVSRLRGLFAKGLLAKIRSDREEVFSGFASKFAEAIDEEILEEIIEEEKMKEMKNSKEEIAVVDSSVPAERPSTVIFDWLRGLKPTRTEAGIFNVRSPSNFDVSPGSSVTIDFGVRCKTHPLLLFLPSFLSRHGMSLARSFLIDTDEPIVATIVNKKASKFLLDAGGTVLRAYVLDNSRLEFKTLA